MWLHQQLQGQETKVKWWKGKSASVAGESPRTIKPSKSPEPWTVVTKDNFNVSVAIECYILFYEIVSMLQYQSNPTGFDKLKKIVIKSFTFEISCSSSNRKKYIRKVIPPWEIVALSYGVNIAERYLVKVNAKFSKK
ncbi:hypothetical protein PoB_005908200 [Plakobranchus ocellatus]|uniref:Uncharacterized protein n=1 Tax=Plakobranchus ocellatus TaxID=259542 RepID=A0AAV4CL84_9GAST|nr:hypothetical protein PoB_005908200 [Plakobranchus ocellatus]